MPIYEYECGTCGKVHEILQKMSDNPLTDCPECSGRLHKRISQCTFHLKGGGWYVTDYANSAGKSSSSETRKKTESGSTETSSTDATACTSACKPADTPST
jgi:putative FmdB family regulatory protein